MLTAMVGLLENARLWRAALAKTAPADCPCLPDCSGCLFDTRYQSRSNAQRVNSMTKRWIWRWTETQRKPRQSLKRSNASTLIIDLAVRSQIMAAWAFYQDNDYPKAVASLDRFIELNPADPLVEYAHYLDELTSPRTDRGC